MGKESNIKGGGRDEQDRTAAKRTPVAKEPKPSSLAPVSAHEEPDERFESPDLLPRIVTVTLGLTVVGLITIYALRRPPRVDSAAVPDQEIQRVAGVDDEPDWLREHSPFAGDPAKAPGNKGDVGMRMGATAAGPGFDLASAMDSLDAIELKARECWTGARTDSVTIIVRFIPEGLAVSSKVEDAEVVGDAAACFETAFRRASVPAYMGEEETVRRTILRP